MLVPTLTNHVDSLPLKAHWLNADLPNDPSTHPHLFLGPCSFSPGFFTVSPVSGAALFPIYWNQWQSYFSLPLSLLLALATLKFRCRCRFRISSCWSTIHSALLSCIANATRPQSIPGILFIPGRSPYLNKYWGCQVLQKNGKNMEIYIRLVTSQVKRGLQATQKATLCVLWLENKPVLSKKYFHLQTLALY